MWKMSYRRYYKHSIYGIVLCWIWIFHTQNRRKLRLHDHWDHLVNGKDFIIYNHILTPLKTCKRNGSGAAIRHPILCKWNIFDNFINDHKSDLYFNVGLVSWRWTCRVAGITNNCTISHCMGNNIASYFRKRRGISGYNGQ